MSVRAQTSGTGPAGGSSRPYNIILLMTDQHRSDHVGFLPGSRCATPNLDRLAGSAAFTNCVTVNPICTPARTALLTGKYTHQIGTLCMSGDISPEHPTYLRALQRAGYWTAGVGKLHWLQNFPWDIGRGRGHDLAALRPRIMEFGLDCLWEASGKQLALWNDCDYTRYLKQKGLLDRYRDHIEACGPNSMCPEQTKFTGDPWPFDEDDYIDSVIGRELLAALRARPAGRPFFLFGSFCGPHKPYDPPASELEAVPYEEQDDFIPGDPPLSFDVKRRLFRLRRAYKAMVGAVDKQVGRFLDLLESQGLLETTVILFTSDHGEMLGDHGRMSKMQPWRQSVLVPAAIRHPAYLAGRQITAPIESTDLTATILDVAGLDPRAALTKPFPAFHDRVPCRSLLPIVRGEAAAVRETAFSESSGWWQMVQSRRWKYVRYVDGGERAQVSERLYDLEADPCEQHSRAADPSLRETMEKMRRERERVIDSTPCAQLGWAPIRSEHPKGGGR